MSPYHHIKFKWMIIKHYFAVVIVVVVVCIADRINANRCWLIICCPIELTLNLDPWWPWAVLRLKCEIFLFTQIKLMFYSCDSQPGVREQNYFNGHEISYFYESKKIYFELQYIYSKIVIDRNLNLNRNRKYRNFGLSVPKPKPKLCLFICCC